MEAGPLEDWQQEVIGEEEEELLEDWAREGEEGGIKEDNGSKHEVDDMKEGSEDKMRTEEKRMNSMGLPFLTGISPAGFLSANRKKPGGTDHLVQVRTPHMVMSAGSCCFLNIWLMFTVFTWILPPLNSNVDTEILF